MKQRSIDRQLRGAKKKHKRNVKREPGCGNKIRYRDHGEAIVALHNAREHAGGTRTIPIRCYECHHCGGYHLTSQESRG